MLIWVLCLVARVGAANIDYHERKAEIHFWKWDLEGIYMIPSNSTLRFWLISKPMGGDSCFFLLS